MGSTETKPLFFAINSENSLFKSFFAENYQLLKELKHPELGECQVFKHKSQPELVISKCLSGFLAENAEILFDFSKISDNFLRILHISRSSEQIFCGNRKRTAIFCEFFAYTLENELQRRAKDLDFLKESELWYLLQTLVISGAVLQAKSQHFRGFLSASSIFLTENGRLKLMPPAFFCYEASNYMRILADSKEKWLLSPILLQGLRNNQAFVKHNEVKSDVFICGLIALYAASLCNVRDFFDYKQKIFNRNDCETLLLSLRNKYSQLFVNILFEMIQENEENRPDFQELELILRNHQPQEIMRRNTQFLEKPSTYYVNFQQFCGNSSDFSRKLVKISPEITRFRPVFVSPQRIYSPTARILNESPISERKNAKNLDISAEMREELRFLRENIEKALERTNRNINKYQEMV